MECDLNVIKNESAKDFFLPMQQTFIQKKTVKRELYIDDGHALKRHKC